MEPLIRHVRFFNLQFLRQDEFREEQQYGNHMRRRLNYALFTDGVAQITPDDLTIVGEGPPSTTNKSIRIKAGMAVGANRDLMEGREIILRLDSQVFDLSASFTGGTVWVTVNYKRDETIGVTVGSSTENSRVDETAEVRFHAADPTGTVNSDGDPLIVLGTVTYSDMTINNNVVPGRRQIARLRSSLLVSAPSIAFSVATVTQGQTVSMVVTSSTLDLSALVVSNLAFEYPTQITGISIPTRSPGSATIVFTVAGGATLGIHHLTITIPAMTPPNSATNQFTVQAVVPAPTLTLTGAGAFPASTALNAILEINGTNFISPVRVRFNSTGVEKTTFTGTGESLTANQIRLRVPGAGVGTGTLTIFAAGGSVTTPSINI